MRALIIWILLVLSSGCRADDPRLPVRIGEFLVSEGPAFVSEVRAAFESALDANEVFVAGQHSGAARASVVLVREALDDHWVLRAELEVPAALRAHFAVATITGAARVGSGAQPPEGSALHAAAGRALAGLAAQCQLARGEEAGLELLLTSEEPEEVLVALRYVRDRRVSAQAGRLVGLLQHEEPRIQIAALDVLATVGGADQAAAIVRSIHLLESQGMREAYRALARLGGADAIGFLRFAVANEDEAALRDEAERALSSALARQRMSAAEAARGVDLPMLARGHRQ